MQCTGIQIGRRDGCSARAKVVLLTCTAVSKASFSGHGIVGVQVTIILCTINSVIIDSPVNDNNNYYCRYTQVPGIAFALKYGGSNNGKDRYAKVSTFRVTNPKH